MTFNNIFSKEKKVEKELPKHKIEIDYREKNSLVPASLVRLNFEIEFKELKVADYLLNGIAIERKTISDFLSSMINKHLVNQLQEMQQYPKKLLIIEGFEEENLFSKSQINENAIKGFLLSITLKYNVPIIFSKNSQDTAKYIQILANKKEKENSLQVSKNSLNKKQRMSFILESFQNIGPKNSEKLLKKFKSLRNIFSASQEQLEEEIGKKSESFSILDEKY